MRDIIAVTGIRSEYSYLYSVLKAIKKHPRLRLGIIAAGAHLSKAHGYTVRDIEKDGFNVIHKVKNLSSGNRDVDRLNAISAELSGLSRFLAKRKPDILLVVGDREEPLNVGLIGQYMNIAVAHIGGGDRVMYNVDDQIRHAVTKLAHIHFVTTEESAKRILRMGEQPFRVFNIGSPSLDRIRETPGMSKERLFRYYGFKKDSLNKPLILAIQHPLSTEIKDAYIQMKETMETIKELELPTVISYPNSDAGSRDIIRCIERYRHLPFIRAFKNIPRLQFINTFRHAAALIGNSSCGITESPFMKLPVVNIGNRQKKRLHAGNVLFVSHERTEIKKAIEKSIFDKKYRGKIKRCPNPYGNGYSGRKIANILASIPINEKLLIKDITY